MTEEQKAKRKEMDVVVSILIVLSIVMVMTVYYTIKWIVLLIKWII